MAGNFEEAANNIEDGLFVINNKNVPAERRLRLKNLPAFERRPPGFTRQGSDQARQIEANGGALPRRAGNRQVALMALNDAENHRQPQAGSLPNILRREKRIHRLS